MTPKAILLLSTSLLFFASLHGMEPAIESLDTVQKIARECPYFFANCFTRNLYDFETDNEYGNKLCLPTNANDEAKIKEKLRLLKKRKEKVQDNIIALIENAQKCESDNWVSFTKEGLKSGIAGAGAYATAKLVPATTTALGAPGTVALGACALVGYKIVDAGVEACFSSKDTKRCERLIATIKQALACEPIRPLEEEYIARQDSLPATHRKAIETALIAARKKPESDNGVSAQGLVREMLDFPQCVLALPPGRGLLEDEAWVIAKEQFLNRVFPSLASPLLKHDDTTPRDKGKEKDYGEPIDDDEHLDEVESLDSCYYRDEVKRNLRAMMSAICKSSYKALHERSNTKRDRKNCYLFYGSCGTGKSKAAKLIAQKLGLPCHVLEIRNDFDCLAATLFGEAGNRFHQGSQGTLIQAFLQKNKQGNTAKNVVIILDDIDRGFTSDNNTNVTGLLLFLMKICDRNTSEIPATHYGIPDLDFRNVILIATINKDIRKIPECAALKSRCTFIPFGILSKDRIKAMLRKHLTDEDFDLSSCFNGNNVDRHEVRDAIADFVVERFDPGDIRTQESRAEQLLEEPRENWLELARRYEWDHTEAPEVVPDESPMVQDTSTTKRSGTREAFFSWLCELFGMRDLFDYENELPIE